jgi:single-stranded-DNA-specific exonuclease
VCAPLRLLKDRHVALQVVEDGGGRSWRATAWSRRVQWAERARMEAWGPEMRLDLAFRLTRNWHPEFGGWELEVQEVFAHGHPAQA